MWKTEDIKVFFVLYENGEIYYFNLYPTGELFCREFNKMRQNVEGEEFPMAHVLEFVGNSFILRSEQGRMIYSLEQYRKVNNLGESVPIKQFYIDKDVYLEMVNQGKITFDEFAKNIPGLSFDTSNNTKVRLMKKQ